MLHDFLDANSEELIERCRARVTARSAPRPTPKEIEHGIPLFLSQLIETLRLQEKPGAMEDSAIRHGHELQEHGYTVDQVVHDYGDLCQAVTELAVERGTEVASSEFGTLNRCLDNAIAVAVTEFGRGHDAGLNEDSTRATSERLGFLAHELRNYLNTATLSFAAIKTGSVPVRGATSAVLDRSLAGLAEMIDRALADVRLGAGVPPRLVRVPVDRFIADVRVGATLGARERGCAFSVSPVDPALAIAVDRQLLYSAVSNLLQNAFKFTRTHGHVSLKAHARDDRVLIEVQDECGGLPPGSAETMFVAFAQQGADRSGLGLGLSIARRAVEACGGTLSVRDMPGLGCVFTIELAREGAAKKAA